MKLTKEDKGMEIKNWAEGTEIFVEDIRKNKRTFTDSYWESNRDAIVDILLSRIDHLEERVGGLTAKCQRLGEANQDDALKIVLGFEEEKNLQSQLDQLRAACKPIAEFVEHTTDDNWSIRITKGGEISGKIFRRIAELVKGGKENG